MILLGHVWGSQSLRVQSVFIMVKLLLDVAVVNHTQAKVCCNETVLKEPMFLGGIIELYVPTFLQVQLSQGL